MGATGAGKSTLLDGFFNFLLGVKWEDPYRFKLVSLKPEEKERLKKDETASHTEWITAYTIPYRGGASILPYDLNIIDTPGFGDTRGIEQDQRIFAQMKCFFENSLHHGIHTLSGVCFVVQAALPKLTPTQRYIFHQILAIFGKDIEENIFPLVTFCDAQKPKVLGSLKNEIPFKKHFKFNNSALFLNHIESSWRRSNDDDTDSDDDGNQDGFDLMFWNMCINSYAKFFKTNLISRKK